MQANQLRLWFASMAYVLLSELRRIALRHTQFAFATCGTIRLKLLKIGALVRRSVRRIKFAMQASGFPWQGPSSHSPTSICNAPSRDSRARPAAPDSSAAPRHVFARKPLPMSGSSDR